MDPIIRSFGDVVIGEYEGSSLHILAGGSVDIGTAEINAPDPGELGIDFLQEIITLSDGTVLEIDGGAQPTLDIRAGVDLDALGILPLQLRTGFGSQDELNGSGLSETTTPSNANIIIGDGYIAAPNGLILLTNQYQPNDDIGEGDIVVIAGEKGIYGDGLDARGFGGKGGSIYIDTRRDIEVVNSFIATNSPEEAGDIILIANGNILFDRQNSNDTGIFSRLEESGSGVGGNIRIQATNLDLMNEAKLVASSSGIGRSGDINIEVLENLSLAGAGRSAIENDIRSTANGNGGDINIKAGALVVKDGSIISSDLIGSGVAGNINLDLDKLIVNDSTISSIVKGSGRAGDINIIAENITLDGEIVDINEIGLQPGGILSQVNFGAQDGQSGNVSVTSNKLDISNGSKIQVATFGDGDAGNLFINTSKLNIFNSEEQRPFFSTGIFGGLGSDPRAEELSTGQGGSVEIKAKDIIIRNRGEISADNRGIGRAGDILIESQSLLVDRASISATTFSRGDAGRLAIKSSDSITLIGEQSLGSDISPFGPGGLLAQVNAEAEGSGGSILVETNKLTIQDGSKIQAATFGRGNAGNLQIDAKEIKIFDTQGVDSFFTTGIFGGAQRDSRVSEPPRGNGGEVIILSENIELEGAVFINNNVDQAAIGDAGPTFIDTSNLFLDNGAAVRTTTEGEGNAGPLTIIADFVKVSNSAISSGIFSGGKGDGGQLELRAENVELTDGGQINSFVSRSSSDSLGNVVSGGEGKGGDILVDVEKSLTLTGIDDDGFSSAIISNVERDAPGTAGNIQIIAGQFTASSGAVISASTSSSSSGGAIDVSANSLDLLSGAQIVSSTRSSGQAGAVSLDVSRNVLISGEDPRFLERANAISDFILDPSDRFEEVSDVLLNEGSQSGVYANSSESATGNGNQISVTAESLILESSGVITTRSLGKGDSGNISVSLENIFSVQDGELSTFSNQSTGGSVSISAGSVQLSRNSDIETFVNQGSGEGGDIIISSNSILAFDDSDILTFAQDGEGGDIIFETPAFFGENYIPNSPAPFDNNDRVDINASGTVNGIITLPDVTFIQDSLTDLPESILNPDTLVANSCVVRTVQESQGQFLITGTGGLPTKPSDSPTATYTTGTIRSTEASVASTSDNDAVSYDPIEPQGLYRLTNGRLVLSRECDKQPDPISPS